MTDSVLAAVYAAVHGRSLSDEAVEHAAPQQPPADPVASTRQRAAAIAAAEIQFRGGAEAVEQHLLAQRVIRRSLARLNGQFDAVRGNC
jgi:hypothetical protein